MQHVAPRRQRFIGGHEDGQLAQIAFIDDAKEHVRGIRRMREVPDLVEYQHMRLEIRRERGVERAEAGRVREFADQDIGRDEARVVPVLQRAIGDRDDQMRLAGPLGPLKIALRPPVTNSTPSKLPSICCRSAD